MAIHLIIARERTHRKRRRELGEGMRWKVTGGGRKMRKERKGSNFTNKVYTVTWPSGL